MIYIWLSVLGLSAGLLGGALGVGGGVIFVPGLVYLLGIPIHKAVGISLAAIAPSALAGALKNYGAGNVDLAVAAVLAGAAILGSLLGVSVAHALPAYTLRKVFGVFLIFVGLNSLFDWTGSLMVKGIEAAQSTHE